VVGWMRVLEAGEVKTFSPPRMGGAEKKGTSWKGKLAVAVC
jgi:hypothetical protein